MILSLEGAAEMRYEGTSHSGLLYYDMEMGDLPKKQDGFQIFFSFFFLATDIIAQSKTWKTEKQPQVHFLKDFTFSNE